MRAYLTRNAIRKAVTIPPQKTATHNYLNKRTVLKGGQPTYLGARHLPFCAHASHLVKQLLGAAPKRKRSSLSTTGNSTNTGRVRETDFSEEEADTNARGSLDGRRYKLDKPLAHTRESKEDEDKALNEDSCKCETVRDGAASVVSDNLKGEVCIEAHTGAIGDQHHIIV